MVKMSDFKKEVGDAIYICIFYDKDGSDEIEKIKLIAGFDVIKAASCDLNIGLYELGSCLFDRALGVKN